MIKIVKNIKWKDHYTGQWYSKNKNIGKNHEFFWKTFFKINERTKNVWKFHKGNVLEYEHMDNGIVKTKNVYNGLNRFHYTIQVWTYGFNSSCSTYTCSN